MESDDKKTYHTKRGAYWSSYTPEQRAAYRAKIKATRLAMTPEQKAARAAKIKETYKNMPLEKRAASSAKRSAAMTPERRAAAAVTLTAYLNSLTSEQRSVNAKKAFAARKKHKPASERRDRIRRNRAERRAKKFAVLSQMTHEQRMESARRNEKRREEAAKRRFLKKLSPSTAKWLNERFEAGDIQAPSAIRPCSETALAVLQDRQSLGERPECR